MKTGIVVYYSKNSGYGFVQPDPVQVMGFTLRQEKDLCFDFNAIDKPGFKTIEQGTKVNYKSSGYEIYWLKEVSTEPEEEVIE